MCNFSRTQDHDHFGFLLDTPEVRALVDEALRQVAGPAEHADRIESLKPAFARLLATEGWLPPRFSAPDESSRMGDGIGQYALYRAEDGSLCLFSLVVPARAATPVHDHLAWGLIGVYRGTQHETVYRRLDDGHDPANGAASRSRRSSDSPPAISTRSFRRQTTSTT